MPYPSDVKLAGSLPQTDVATAAVPTCPSCRAPGVTASGTALSASTYWRCPACGDVWNPARMAAPRFSRPRW